MALTLRDMWTGRQADTQLDCRKERKKERRKDLHSDKMSHREGYITNPMGKLTHFPSSVM